MSPSRAPTPHKSAKAAPGSPPRITHPHTVRFAHFADVLSEFHAGLVDASSAKPQPRFKLRAALAKCKTHPTVRLKIEYAPGKAVKINGARPLGDVGRCVQGVLERHPPSHALTLTP